SALPRVGQRAGTTLLWQRGRRNSALAVFQTRTDSIGEIRRNESRERSGDLANALVARWKRTGLHQPHRRIANLGTDVAGCTATHRKDAGRRAWFSLERRWRDLRSWFDAW